MKELHKRNVTGGKLLEIGCGFGFLLDEAKNYFDYRIGTDFSSEAVSHAKSMRIMFIAADLKQFQWHLNQIRLCNNVQCSRACLQPQYLYPGNPKLYGAKWLFGCFHSFYRRMWYKILGKKWPFFIPPEHVCLYNHNSISQLLKQNGFKNIEMFISSHAWPVAGFLSKMECAN